jgi:hypothetical protein
MTPGAGPRKAAHTSRAGIPARHRALIPAALEAADAIRRSDAEWRPGKGWDLLVAELAGILPVTLAR